MRNRLTREDIVPLDNGTNGLLVYHDYLIERRNKYFAHSVNADEQGFTSIAVLPDDATRAPVEVGWSDLRYQGPPVGERNQHLEFVRLILDQLVTPMAESVRVTLLEEIKRLPPQERKELQTFTFAVPGPDSLDVNRHKFSP